jgi:hypothetical protein
MPTEIETTSVEMLERAVANVARAKGEVERQRKRRDRMQRAANKASELEEAAPLERKNAEAKYLVLRNRVKSAEEETKEADRTGATATIIGTAGEWHRTAGGLLEKFQGYAVGFGRGQTAAKKTNTAERVQDESEQVQAALADLEDFRARIAAATEVLQERSPSTGQTGSPGTTGQGSQKPAKTRKKEPAGSGSAADDPKNKMNELKKAARRAYEELVAARAEEQLAPAAALEAQADLQVAEKILQASKGRLAAAEAELSRIQQDYFVERIVVDRPNEKGWADGKAILKAKIPDGYRLSWKAGIATIKANPKGTEVRINVGMLPIGTTIATTAIERIPEDVEDDEIVEDGEVAEDDEVIDDGVVVEDDVTVEDDVVAEDEESSQL